MSDDDAIRNDERAKPKRRRLVRKLLKFLAIVTAVLYLSDFGYSCWASWKHNAWEESITRDANGVMQDCEAFSVGAGETAILLLHGINDTPFTYKKMAAAFAEENFHVRVMRMPGFGEPVDAYAAQTANDWVASVAAEAATLRSSHDRVFIVAHSLGGATAIQTLLRAGDKQTELFDGLILLAPAIEVSSRRSPVFKTQTWHNISSILLFTRFTFTPFAPDTQDPEMRDYPNRIPVTPRSVIDETFGLIDSNRNREAEIKLPVLLVLSEKDQVNDHDSSQNWFEKISSRRKELIWNNQSGHQLPYDFGWSDVVVEIVRFINS